MVEFRLNDEQKRLVDGNRGLVWYQLNRFMKGRGQGARGCDWDDLIQEGYIGLMRAAVRFDAGKRVDFVPFALSRIRTAIVRAAERLWSAPVSAGMGEVVDVAAEPFCEHGGASGGAGLVADGQVGVETLGDRVRDRYDRAVSMARCDARRAKGKDRTELVDRIVADRLDVPSEEYRSGLRALARETRTSFARTQWAERFLTGRVRETLENDAEYGWLRDEAVRHPNGLATPVDDEMESRLAMVVEREVRRRARRLPADGKSRVLRRLIDEDGGRFDEVLDSVMSRMDAREKRTLLSGLSLVVEG
jgi:Sigma-70 region 2